MESKPNPIEITDSGSKAYVYAIGGSMIFALVIVNSVFGLITFSMHTFRDALLVVLLLHLPFSAFFLYFLIKTYGLNIKTSKFIITDKTIEFIQFPKRRPAIINWSDFDTIRLKITGMRKTTLDHLVQKGGPSLVRNLNIKVSRKNLINI